MSYQTTICTFRSVELELQNHIRKVLQTKNPGDKQLAGFCLPSEDVSLIFFSSRENSKDLLCHYSD